MADGYASDGSSMTVSSMASTLPVLDSPAVLSENESDEEDEGRSANITHISVCCSCVRVQTLSGEFYWQIPALGFSEDNLRTMARLLTVSEQWLADRLLEKGSMSMGVAVYRASSVAI